MFFYLHSATAIADDTPVSPPRATASAAFVAETSEKVVETEPSVAEKIIRTPSPTASPARSPAKSPLHPDPVQSEQSPGRGSGTKDDEVVITGSAYNPVKKTVDTLTKTTAPKVKTPPVIDPASSSRLPPHESMSMVEMYDEYFTRLSQHQNLESNLVTLMRKQYLVNFWLIFTILIYSLVPKH